jgi:hypothetical protein
MRYQEALEKAKISAKRTGYIMYVVLDEGVDPDEEGNFYIAEEDELEDWFAGCEVVTAIGADGDIW